MHKIKLHIKFKKSGSGSKIYKSNHHKWVWKTTCKQCGRVTAPTELLVSVLRRCLYSQQCRTVGLCCYYFTKIPSCDVSLGCYHSWAVEALWPVVSSVLVLENRFCHWQENTALQDSVESFKRWLLRIYARTKSELNILILSTKNIVALFTEGSPNYLHQLLLCCCDKTPWPKET